MSVIQPEIDKLLELTQNDRFLLCAVASKRARDINNMMHGQRDRALSMKTNEELIKLSGSKPLSIAMDEIAHGDISYDEQRFQSAIDALNHKNA